MPRQVALGARSYSAEASCGLAPPARARRTEVICSLLAITDSEMPEPEFEIVIVAGWAPETARTIELPERRPDSEAEPLMPLNVPL